MTAAAIKVERRRALGIITLGRPRALNALTLEMVEAFSDALTSPADAAVSRVLVRSALAGAFCAGGDVRLIRNLDLHGCVEEADAFFRTEFALYLEITRVPKPYLALIDGVYFGGGLGLSVHGPYRLVDAPGATTSDTTSDLRVLTMVCGLERLGRMARAADRPCGRRAMRRPGPASFNNRVHRRTSSWPS